MEKVLKNKPLVEAIFELRWQLLGRAPSGEGIDPHYKILVGGMYEKAKSEYPFHEQLPTSEIPDRIAPYMIQHRFRKAEDQWPLIQIGPGIVALNDTVNYVWADFQKNILHLVDTLFEVYPDPENLRVSIAMLRYIDSVEFDYRNDILRFLREKLKMSVEIHGNLFQHTGVSKQPFGLDLKLSFYSKMPKGAIVLRMRRGQRAGTDALTWETIVHSLGEDAPKTKEAVIDWADSAHTLTHNWFFKLIEGDLLEEFE